LAGLALDRADLVPINLCIERRITIMVMEELVSFVCEEVEDRGLVCTAEEEGVKVIVPWDYKEGGEWIVRVEKLPLDSLGELRNRDKDDFWPRRLVTNFVVKDAETNRILHDFDPPIKIKVEYTHDDYDTMFMLGFWKDEDSEPPQEPRWIAFGMGLWDHEKNQWRTFTDGKYDFGLEGDPDKGTCDVTIPSWGDAHIGAGS
jgi:hypothetical protein